MKNLTIALLAFLSVALPSASQAAAPAATSAATSAEDWKGPADNSEVHLGVLGGLSILDFSAGFGLLGTASKKIVHHGFVNEVTDSVSIETELGPVFTQGTTVFSYSLHLRWDFEFNPQWTFYALGGAGGYITGQSFNAGQSASNSFALFPRFGFGTMYRLNDLIQIRGEISHELIAAGVAIPFYL